MKSRARVCVTRSLNAALMSFAVVALATRVVRAQGVEESEPAQGQDAETPATPSPSPDAPPPKAAEQPASAEASTLPARDGTVRAVQPKRDTAGDPKGPRGEAPGESTLVPKARLFVLSELSRRSSVVVSATGVPEDRRTTSLDLSVQNARVGLEYQSPLPWLSLQIEAELAGKIELKDAFARAEDEHWGARVGQFKMPIGGLEMQSPWDLPHARRGFVNELLTGRLDIAGRRPGVTLAVRGSGKLRPGLVLGVFQGSALLQQTSDDRDTTLIEHQGMDSQSWLGRAELRSKRLDLGLVYEHRLGAPALDETRHFWTLGADGQWALNHSSGGLRLWADVLAGASWYEHAGKPADGDDAVFVTVRTLVAHRFGGDKRGDLYVEPFVFGALHDPDTDVEMDQALEGMLGVAVGFWRRARLTLQGEVVRSRRNFPAAYSVGDPDRVSLLLQAGMAF